MKMEPIKVSIEVSVSLSENTQRFIESLFDKLGNSSISAKSAPQSFQEPVASTQAPASSAPASSAPASSAPASSAPVGSVSSKSIEDVRSMLAKKVNEHRDEIKAKLTELGAPSVTKLSPDKYDEMYNFLASL